MVSERLRAAFAASKKSSLDTRDRVTGKLDTRRRVQWRLRWNYSQF